MNLRVLLGIGLAVTVLGLLLGLIPGSVSDVPCGSPWVRDTATTDAATRGSRLGSDLIGGQVGRRFESTDYTQMCSDELGSRGVVGGVLAGLGVLTLLGAALVSVNRTSAARE